MRNGGLLHKLNRNSGVSWSPIPKPPPPGRERLYGVHSVRAALDVAAKALQQQDTRAHTTGSVAPRRVFALFVRDFRKSLSPPASHGLTDSGGDPHFPFLPTSSYLFLHDVCRRAGTLGVPINPVERNELTYLCGERRNQNVVLETTVFREKTIDLRASSSMDASRIGEGQTNLMSFPTLHPHETCLVLDKVIDPMNVGNILRTAYFFGVRSVILSSDCASCTPVVARASTGYLEYISIYRAGTALKEILGHAAARNPAVRIVGTVARSHFEELSTTRVKTSLTVAEQPVVGSHPRSGPTLVLMGNEDKGLTADLLKLCTHLVHVPACGETDEERDGRSLNVNSACAVVLAHLSGQTPLIIPKQ